MRERYPAWAAKMAAYLSAPSPQDQAALAAVRRARRSPAPEQGLRFLWIGRWVPHKGTERLLHFVRERLASHPRDRFTVAGCGPGVAVDIPAPWIENGTVRLLPSFQRPDLFTLLGEHDVGLFTSEVEGWGLCLNEMLEAGLRVVATQAGGLADLDSVLPGEILSFADVARLEEPWPPPGLLPATYRQRFSWPAIAASYEQAAMPRQHRCAC
jgi:glycosyltransferase involved in cell wall biosynthesis